MWKTTGAWITNGGDTRCSAPGGGRARRAAQARACRGRVWPVRCRAPAHRRRCNAGRGGRGATSANAPRCRRASCMQHRHPECAARSLFSTVTLEGTSSSTQPCIQTESGGTGRPESSLRAASEHSRHPTIDSQPARWRSTTGCEQGRLQQSARRARAQPSSGATHSALVSVGCNRFPNGFVRFPFGFIRFPIGFVRFQSVSYQPSLQPAARVGWQSQGGGGGSLTAPPLISCDFMARSGVVANSSAIEVQGWLAGGSPAGASGGGRPRGSVAGATASPASGRVKQGRGKHRIFMKGRCEAAGGYCCAVLPAGGGGGCHGCGGGAPHSRFAAASAAAATGAAVETNTHSCTAHLAAAPGRQSRWLPRRRRCRLSTSTCRL